MGKAEVGTPKYLANKMKSKGLQKLRWFCQMCQKQCRDQNGFKCHTMSESHQRQLLLFADNPNKFLGGFSYEFESAFLNLLKRCHNTKRVFANAVYQEYIRDKSHVHMNATRWETLSGFVQYLGRTGKCVVDNTEKGWYITWIDRDPETIARQEAMHKKEKMSKDDEEKLAKFISQQVERGQGSESDAVKVAEYAEFKRSDEEEKISLTLDMKVKPSLTSGTFKKPLIAEQSSQRKSSTSEKRKKSALDEIMEEDLKRKSIRRDKEEMAAGKEEEAKGRAERRWLKKGIVVKIITKSLGDKYYKQKGHVTDVVGDDRMGAVVVLNSNGCRLKLDQSHLETVIPAVGKTVLILNGRLGGEKAVLQELDVAKFSSKLKLLSTGETVTLPYERFSKLNNQQQQ